MGTRCRRPVRQQRGEPAAAAAAAAVSARQPGSPALALPSALGAVSPFRFHFVACLRRLVATSVTREKRWKVGVIHQSNAMTPAALR